jgi:hypothetical protein
MGIPQVPDQVRRAPTEVLRAVFAGIGRILMTAESRWRSLDQTGNVRLLSAEEMANRAEAISQADTASASPATTSGPAASATATATTAAIPPAGPAGTATAAATPTAEQLPLPDYDNLSLPSIRARLRVLDVTQLRALAEYEARNAERTDVLGMLERRIEKLESGS